MEEIFIHLQNHLVIQPLKQINMEDLKDKIAIEIMKILIKERVKTDNINDYTSYITFTSYNLANEMIKEKLKTN